MCEVPHESSQPNKPSSKSALFSIALLGVRIFKISSQSVHYESKIRENHIEATDLSEREVLELMFNVVKDSQSGRNYSSSLCLSTMRGTSKQ